MASRLALPFSAAQSTAPRPIIIDTDPGIDDSVALLLALASPELEVRGITVVAGNAPLETTVHNALQVVSLAARTDVPVFAGCARPLVREPIRGKFSGIDGLGGVKLASPAATPAAEHAVDFLIRSLSVAAEKGEKLTLCMLAPMTNLAVALRLR
ncbi:nucleoside hydrolase, partial [Paraburkholderia tropica]|uniref:nucleoside hydrolase n=1 Tax=Paraburkholderia tropica TaxID=92647 RepID=UPI002AB6CCCE